MFHVECQKGDSKRALLYAAITVGPILDIKLVRRSLDEMLQQDHVS